MKGDGLNLFWEIFSYFLNLPLYDAGIFVFLLIQKGLAASSLEKWRHNPASHLIVFNYCELLTHHHI